MMMVMMMIIILMIMMLMLILIMIKIKLTEMIILTMEGAYLDCFLQFSTAPRTVSNTYAQLARAQSCANHVQCIGSLSHASCNGQLGTEGQQ